MPYIVPKDELTIDDLKAYRDNALALLEKLIRSVGKHPEDFVFRDILPSKDLGFSTDEWKISYSAADTWETKVDVTLPENKFIVFYGYANKSATPKTVGVKFFSGAVPIEVIQVERLYTKDDPTGYFRPFGFKEGEELVIQFYGNATGDDEPVLLGVVAELRGTTINPSS